MGMTVFVGRSNPGAAVEWPTYRDRWPTLDTYLDDTQKDTILQSSSKNLGTSLDRIASTIAQADTDNLTSLALAQGRLRERWRIALTLAGLSENLRPTAATRRLTERVFGRAHPDSHFAFQTDIARIVGAKDTRRAYAAVLEVSENSAVHENHCVHRVRSTGSASYTKEQKTSNRQHGLKVTRQVSRLTEREHTLTALVEEVLGHATVPYEILPEDQEPQGEYVTGVLAPAFASRMSADIESDADEAAQETGSPDPQEDQDSGGSSVTTGIFSPALDPKALPRSIGISFTLRSPERMPELEVCCTWARYHERRDGWKRQPASFLTGSIDATQDRTWNAAEGVRLQLRSRAVPGGTWRVSLFLINTTEQAEPEGRPLVSEHIFQPQIRVYCRTGTELIPVRQNLPEAQSNNENTSLTSEDASLDLVYSDRFALARGHSLRGSLGGN